MLIGWSFVLQNKSSKFSHPPGADDFVLSMIRFAKGDIIDKTKKQTQVRGRVAYLKCYGGHLLQNKPVAYCSLLESRLAPDEKLEDFIMPQ